MINKAAELGPSLIPWWQDWRGQCSVIVASGPSAKTAGVDKLRGRKVRVIAVNDSHRLIPWADILYSCDMGWWLLYKGVPEFKGLKITHEPATVQHFPMLKKIHIEKTDVDDLLVEKPTYLGSGGNSGFQAFNLSAQFGSPKIALIGVDCTIDHGFHWHDRHPVPLSNPLWTNVGRWQKAFNQASAQVVRLGLEVVNCSPVSTVTAYPKMSVDEIIKRWEL